MISQSPVTTGICVPQQRALAAGDFCFCPDNWKSVLGWTLTLLGISSFKKAHLTLNLEFILLSSLAWNNSVISHLFGVCYFFIFLIKKDYPVCNWLVKL